MEIISGVVRFRFAPVMSEVAKAAEEGKYILGICNGFQILTEAGLLPGALRRNDSMKFRAMTRCSK